MPMKADAPLFQQILLIAVILLILGIIWRGSMAVIADPNLSLYAKGFMGLGLLIVLAGIIYVIIQRVEMKKHETFRREKW